MASSVHIGDVTTFKDVSPDKAQALKPLEEAAETFAAWQAWNQWNAYYIENKYPLIDLSGTSEFYKRYVIDECCDNIMATCNLLASLGVTDIGEAMVRCVERNRKRGRL